MATVDVAKKTTSAESAAKSLAASIKNGTQTANANKSTSTSSKTSSGSSGSGSSFADSLKQTAVNSVAAKTGASASTLNTAANQAINNTVRSSGSSSGSSGGSSGSVAVSTPQIVQTGSAGATPAASGYTGQGTSTAGVTAGYTPKGTYNDAELRAANGADQIDYWKNQYDAAKARGDVAGMREAHAQAEIIRSSLGYSGGGDGSQYIGTPQNTPSSNWSVDYNGNATRNNIIDGVYVDPNDQNRLSATDLQTLIGLKKEYATASAARRQQINQEAEAMRAKYGYSLGTSGNQYSAVDLGEDMLPQTGLPSYEMDADLVNNVYDRLNDATLSQLLASYNNSRAEAEYQASKLPALYQAQRNATSADNEREKMAFREQAAANGLNAGNRSQAALAFSNQLQNSLGQLNTAEANALADAQHDLTQLYISYQQQIAQAVSENNYQRAAALMQEYQTAQQSRVNTAVAQANLNMQVADFNRQTRQNQVAAQQQAWQNQFDLANLLAGYGNMGIAGGLGGLTQDQINQLQRQYAVLQAGQYYPILRGYGLS